MITEYIGGGPDDFTPAPPSWQSKVPEGAKYIDPPAMGPIAFWMWPSITITTTAFLVIAYFVPWMTFVATLPSLIYGGLVFLYNGTVRDIQREPSRYLRVKHFAYRPDNASFVVATIKGSPQLYLRFPDATEALLYAIEHGNFHAREKESCWG